ncbi:MAG: C-type lectin domain-containing protein, partial [Solirubrobacterales bacterium]
DTQCGGVLPAVVAGPLPGNGHVYYLLAPATWHAAEARALALGGHLATIQTLAENDWVSSNVASLAPSPGHLWIGLEDFDVPPLRTRDSFHWIGGDPSPYRNWRSDNPEFLDTEFCTLVLGPGTPPTEKPKKWVNLICANIYNAVVEVSPPFYANDFEGAVGSEWSRTDVATTPPPSGGRKFLGEFATDSVSLTLSGLTSHSQVTISFDLFVLKSWDGNSTVHGADEWQVAVAGGPTLLRTTFNNCPTVTALDGQAYPLTYPGGQNTCRTGATEVGTLGYAFNDGFTSFPSLDTVYRVTQVFPHSGSTLTLNFSGTLRVTSDVSDESWGLDNVAVELLP